MFVMSKAALLFTVAFAHPGSLQCGDERFTSGSTSKCMTLDIVDKTEDRGIHFGTRQRSYTPGGEVHLGLSVQTPGPYDNSTGQDPYGIFFTIHATAPKSSSHQGSFTSVPETVSLKDEDACANQLYLNNNGTLGKGARFTWTADAATCGDVNFNILYGNGPGDTPLAPASPFVYRAVLTVAGPICKHTETTTTTTPASEQWVCSVCAHVYDAEKDGAGAAFEDLPDDWVCPVCGQPKSAYKRTMLKTNAAAEQWVCSVCAHVYDAEKDGAGAAFEDLPDDWVCPVCSQPKSAYTKQTTMVV